MNGDRHARLFWMGYVVFAATVLFVVMPGLLIAANRDDIDYPLTYYLYFSCIGLIVLLIFLLLSSVISRAAIRSIAMVLGAYALSVYVADVFFPLKIGPLETGQEIAYLDYSGSLVQLIIFALMIWFLVVLPAQLTGRVCWAAAAVLVVVSGGTTVWTLRPDLSTTVQASPVRIDGNFNIYHFVFDAYAGPRFEYGLKKMEIPQTEFAGFTHYRRTMSNAWYTKISFTSFLSGTLYDPKNTVTEWKESADRSSLIPDLKSKGYNTIVYALRNRTGLKSAQEHRLAARAPAAKSTFLLMLDYWALRVAPVALRPYSLTKGKGVFTRAAANFLTMPLGDIRSYRSYMQFLDLLDDEEKRPAQDQYVFMHVYPPHNPYQLDRRGNYVGKSSYEEQLLLATSMMRQLVQRLKELGRFDNSMIIIQSDHGTVRKHAHDQHRDIWKMDDATSEAIANNDVRKFSGHRLARRHSALLLIKPPSACGLNPAAAEFVVVDQLAELRQIRRFVNDMVTKPGAGCSYPASSAVDVLHGLKRQVDAEGNTLHVGEDLKSGRLNHYRITQDPNSMKLNWEIVGDIPFRH